MSGPRIASLQVGLPRTLGTPGAADPMARPWTTGFFKEPVVGPVRLDRTNLTGDGQADLVYHGGPDKAVCVYPLARYPFWSEELRRDLPPGAFGENLTVEGQAEADVCIGDVYAVGDALVEVSQPRSPCWKLARRWGAKRLALRFQETGWTGWYLRVLREGEIAAGQALALVARPSPAWPVLRANALAYDRAAPDADLAGLAACPALGASWRRKLLARLESGRTEDEARRVYGPNLESDADG